MSKIVYPELLTDRRIKQDLKPNIHSGVVFSEGVSSGLSPGEFYLPLTAWCLFIKLPTQ